MAAIKKTTAFLYKDYRLDKDLHVWHSGKFVLMPDGTMVIGDIDRHAVLVFLHENPDATAVSNDQANDTDGKWRGKILAAGKYWIEDGQPKIASWHSIGMGAPNPSDELKDDLRVALAQACIDHPELIVR